MEKLPIASFLQVWYSQRVTWVQGFSSCISSGEGCLAFIADAVATPKLSGESGGGVIFFSGLLPLSIASLIMEPILTLSL